MYSNSSLSIFLFSENENKKHPFQSGGGEDAKLGWDKKPALGGQALSQSGYPQLPSSEFLPDNSMAKRNIVQSHQLGSNIRGQHQGTNFLDKILRREPDRLKLIEHHLSDLNQRTSKIFDIAIDIQRNIETLLNKVKQTSATPMIIEEFCKDDDILCNEKQIENLS